MIADSKNNLREKSEKRHVRKGTEANYEIFGSVLQRACERSSGLIGTERTEWKFLA